MAFKTKEEFSNPELRKKIVKLKSDGLALKLIQSAIKEEFNIDISLPTIQTIFDKEVAKTTLQSPSLRDTIKADYGIIHERYEKVVKMIDDLIKAFEQLREKVSPETYLKYSPIVIALSREVLNQLDFIRKEQERITIQQKNLIYSPIQIINVIDEKIREYEKEGRIKVLQLLPSEEKKEAKEEEDENDRRTK